MMTKTTVHIDTNGVCDTLIVLPVKQNLVRHKRSICMNPHVSPSHKRNDIIFLGTIA